MKKIFLLKLSPLATLPLVLISCGSSSKDPIENPDLKLANWEGESPTLSSTIFPKMVSFELLKEKEGALPFAITSKAFVRLFEKSAITLSIEEANVEKVFLDKQDPYLQSVYFIIAKGDTKYLYHSKNLNEAKNFKFPPYKIPFEETDPNNLAPFGVGAQDWNKPVKEGFDPLLLESQLKTSYWHIDHEHVATDYIMEIPLRIMIFDKIDENFVKEGDKAGSALFHHQEYFRDWVVLYSELYAFRYLFGTREQFLSEKAFSHIKLFNMRSSFGNPDLGDIKQDDITFGYQYISQDQTVLAQINNVNKGSLTLNWLLWKKRS